MIAALANLASSWINSRTAKQNTDNTNRANKELAEYSYGKDMEMWNSANKYNSPFEQMDRLRAAGLNPNLVYGNGAAQSTAAPAPKYNAPRMDYNYKPAIDPLAMLGAFQNFKIQNAQIDNMRMQNKILEEEGKNKKTLGFILGNNLDKQAGELGWLKRGGLDDISKSNQWRQLDSQLSFQEGKLNTQATQIGQMTAGTRLQNLTADMYDWNSWTRILQGFGVKLPSLNLRKR